MEYWLCARHCLTTLPTLIYLILKIIRIGTCMQIGHFIFPEEIFFSSHKGTIWASGSLIIIPISQREKLKQGTIKYFLQNYPESEFQTRHCGSKAPVLTTTASEADAKINKVKPLFSRTPWTLWLKVFTGNHQEEFLDMKKFDQKCFVFIELLCKLMFHEMPLGELWATACQPALGFCIPTSLSPGVT